MPETGWIPGCEFDPGLGKSPGEGYSNLLHYSSQENSMDREDPRGYNPWSYQKLGIFE